MESHSQGDVPNTNKGALISIDLDHLRSCCHSLKNCSNVSTFTYNFFQKLNETCVQLNTANSIPKQHTLNVINSIESSQNEPIESSERDDSVYIIQQLSQELFSILSQKSNINQNVLKMASITFINTLSLICNIEVIVKFVLDIIQLEDSTTTLTWVWSNLENNKSCSIKIDIDAMVALKIMLTAGSGERDWWHVTEYKSLVVLILSFLSSHCSNKFLHHLVFSLQALKHCLDHTLKHDHTLIEESLQSKVFEVILGNWENYIPSVMDHNLLLCESFIRVLKRFDVDDEDVEKKKFWDFLTNVSCTLKSKYYMMAACFLADFYYKSIFTEPWFLENMAYSLSRSYLVTAGAYCHKVLAKNILDENRWKEIFLGRVIELVCHSDISIRQNVCNYWLPAAVKQYPTLIQPLYDLVLSRYDRAKARCLTQENIYCRNRDMDQLQRYLHAVILIVKLERPGKFNATTHACVQDAMRCSDEMIRGDAFLCCQTFHGVKCHVPMSGMSEDSCQVFEDLYRFLEENINCDDATLRQTMYKVFKNYVINTECQFRKCVVPLDLKVRHKGSTEPFQLPDFMHSYIDQYAKLYSFFTANLSTKSNYQRLITTLNFLNILFENITFPMTENQKKKRRLTKDYLKEIGKWDFESAFVRDRVFDCLAHDTNDVRVMAKHLLVSYFSYTSSDEDVRTFFAHLATSLEMNASNVFYTAESGAYGVVVLASLFYKAGLHRTSLREELLARLMRSNEEFTDSSAQQSCSEQASVCRKVEMLTITSDTPPTATLFSKLFLDRCQDQAARLQEDIVSAVKNKNCLHGSLTALMLLVTDPASPERCTLDPAATRRLLHLLHSTCLHLLDLLCMSSRSTNFAPSFGEMGEAMASLITSAEEGEDDAAPFTLSPAHQTLFNCIWMNLKTACTFASALAVASRDSLTRDQVVFACQIIAQVLHKCRHKGAIQNAGLALGALVTQCLQGDSYPLQLLQDTLHAALASTPGGTVSRKSAGVAILVHKLLASPHASQQSLVTAALDKCLAVASDPVVTSEETLKVDLPQVIAFHMLQFIVADASLRVAMTSYLELLTRLCLDKMQSQEWTVRNGALQVFGVLLPKLVGTKKQDAASHSSNVAFEEFFYQLPRIGDSVRDVLCRIQEPGRDVSGLDKTNTQVSGSEKTNIHVSGLDKTNTQVSGSEKTNIHVSGSDETNTPVSGLGKTNIHGSGLDKTNIHITGSDKTNTHVSGSDKTNTHVSGSAETNTQVSGSDKTNTHVSGSDKTNTHVSGSEKTNIHVSGSDETNTHVSGSEKTNIHVSGSDKTNTHVSGSDKTNTHVSGSDKTNTHVSGSAETNTQVSGSDKTNTHVSGSDKTNTHVSGSDKTNTHVSGSDKTNTHMSGSDKTNTHVSGSDKTNTHMSGSDKTNTQVSGSDKTNTHVSGSDKTNTHVSGSDKTNTHVSGSDKTNTHVSGSDKTNTHMSGLDKTNTHVSGSDKTNTHVSGLDETNTHGSDETNTSVLVSALTLLSRLKVTGGFGRMNPEQAALQLFLRRVYSRLLASHMHTVRFLVANCYVNSLHAHTELRSHFESMLFSCLEYISRGRVLKGSLPQYFGSPKMNSFLRNDSRPKILNENHLHGSLLTLEILKERIYLENLELDELVLNQMVTFLNTTVPLMVADTRVKLGTYSLLFKIFRAENARLAPSCCNGRYVLSCISDVVDSFKQNTRVGWKLFLQELVKFQMFNTLFVGDGKIDCSYITLLVRELSRESDILKDVLTYLLQLLKEQSLRSFDAMDALHRSTHAGVSSVTWTEAYNCIKDLLKTVVFSDCKMANTCAEHVFHVIIQIYTMFASYSVSFQLFYDSELLHMGSELFAIYCTKHAVEYICPAVLPVLSLCVSLPLPKGIHQTASVDIASVPGICIGNSPKRRELVEKINNLSNTFIRDEKCNEEYRYHAAVSMSILHHQNTFGQLTHDIVANTIHLLQDEVYEVRQEITYFVRKMEGNYRERTEKFILLKNPYVYLFNFLNCSYAVDVHVYLDVFTSLLFVTQQDMNRSETYSAFCNPFDHNLRNFYSEPMLVAETAHASLNNLLAQTRTNSFDETKLSDIVAKCVRHIEENRGNVRLNEHGREKLRLLGQAKAHLQDIVDKI